MGICVDLCELLFGIQKIKIFVDSSRFLERSPDSMRIGLQRTRNNWQVFFVVVVRSGILRQRILNLFTCTTGTFPVV